MIERRPRERLAVQVEDVVATIGARLDGVGRQQHRAGPKGVGGLNLWKAWVRYRIGLHAHIFFLGAEDLIHSKRIKQIKRPANAGVSRRPSDGGRENDGFIFRWLLCLFLGGPEKCREIQGGGGEGVAACTARECDGRNKTGRPLCH